MLLDSCYNHPKLITYRGTSDANGRWKDKETYAAQNAFKAGGYWASVKNQLPATIWYKFDQKKNVSRIEITCIKSETPLSFQIVASNDCQTWEVLLMVEDSGMDNENLKETFDIPCGKQKSYRCYGIRNTGLKFTKPGCIGFSEIKMYGPG